MKKKNFLLTICTLLLTLLMGTVSVIAAETDNETVNRFNVVFVVDGSGSMKDTDVEGWRYEAIDQFLGLLTNSGNKAGFVVFDDDIIQKSDIEKISGVKDKKKISKNLRNSQIRNDTNIGKALELATSMLQDGGDKNLKSAIILLSDGNTDLPNDKDGKQLAASKVSKQNAINTARDNGYPVYSVCLNANNKANLAELQDISNATGGDSMEVTKAQDLQAVFQKFYNLIYGTGTVSLWDSPVPETGSLDIPFEVPQVGVEEVNIIINNGEKLSNITVFQPSGIAFSNDEINKMKMDGDTFTIIKIAHPDAGEWKLTAKGIPGDKIKIDMIFNASIELNLKTADGKTEYIPGDKIQLVTELISNGEVVSDQKIYKQYPALLYIQKGEDEEIQEIPMKVSDAAYTADLEADVLGTYKVWVEVNVESTSGRSKKMEINVGNQSPVATEEIIKKKVVKFPIGRKVQKISLDELAEDPEGTALTYKISYNPYASDVAYIEGKELCLNKKDISKGEIKLLVSDLYGASCEIMVKITIVDMVKYLMIAVIAIICFIILLLLIKKIRTENLRFNGDITVTAFDYDDGGEQLPETNTPAKGKSQLRLYIDDGCGIQIKGSFFAATGKDYILFKSAKGYYSSSDTAKRNKSIRIDRDYEVVISNNEDLNSGIKVVFSPYRFD